MRPETSLQWKNKKEGKLASRHTKGLNIALHEQANRNSVKSEFSRKRTVYFKVRDGKLGAQASNGKRLCRSQENTMFSAQTDLTVMAVPNKKGEVKLHLDRRSKKNLKELDKNRRMEKFSNALDEVQKHGKQKRRERKS